MTEKPIQRETVVHDPFIDGLEARRPDEDRAAVRRSRARSAPPRRRPSAANG